MYKYFKIFDASYRRKDCANYILLKDNIISHIVTIGRNKNILQISNAIPIIVIK